jgi:hypothetical protein
LTLRADIILLPGRSWETPDIVAGESAIAHAIRLGECFHNFPKFNPVISSVHGQSGPWPSRILRTGNAKSNLNHSFLPRNQIINAFFFLPS